MNLEMVTANYFDLGVTDYSEIFELQKQIAEKRAEDEIDDTILIAEHFPVVNFGSREVHNNFSEKFIKELESKGIEFTEENAINYLKTKGIDFSRTSRGGGATFIRQGQINFYPIVKYERISQEILNIEKYKKIIDSIMHSVIEIYGIDAKIHKDLRNDDEDAKKSSRKDIWVVRDGKNFKIGGKGIYISRGVAYHGFNFYLKEGCTDGFEYVNPCGYKEDELKTISIEEVLGKKVDSLEFKNRVLREIQKQFRYDSFI